MTIEQFHLDQLPKDHVRNVWQPGTDDLHMNVLVLRDGEEIAPHVNRLLDVLVTCLRGNGTITIDDQPVSMLPGSIVMISQGTHRHIRAGNLGMVYTTVHRKRGGLMPTVSDR